jgi:cob(I)alamin adenosyltransferase
MRIATKSGDKGTTGLLFGKRVSKQDYRIQLVGDVDELNAAIGFLKASLDKQDSYRAYLETIQHSLTLFMGELVSEPEKRKEYVEKYDYVKEADMDLLDQKVDVLQDMKELDQQGWVLYGNSEKGARADLSSKICRRAERALVFLVDTEKANQEYACRDLLIKYINRLSDFLHLLARFYDYCETGTYQKQP